MWSSRVGVFTLVWNLNFPGIWDQPLQLKRLNFVCKFILNFLWNDKSAHMACDGARDELFMNGLSLFKSLCWNNLFKLNYWQRAPHNNNNRTENLTFPHCVQNSLFTKKKCKQIMETISGLKSILRVVLPAGAGPLNLALIRPYIFQKSRNLSILREIFPSLGQ